MFFLFASCLLRSQALPCLYPRNLGMLCWGSAALELADTEQVTLWGCVHWWQH